MPAAGAEERLGAQEVDATETWKKMLFFFVWYKDFVPESLVHRLCFVVQVRTIYHN